MLRISGLFQAVIMLIVCLYDHTMIIFVEIPFLVQYYLYNSQSVPGLRTGSGDESQVPKKLINTDSSDRTRTSQLDQL